MLEQEEDVGAAVTAFSRNLARRGRASSAPSTMESCPAVTRAADLAVPAGASARAGVRRREVGEVLSAPATAPRGRAGAAVLMVQRGLRGASPGLQ